MYILYNIITLLLKFLVFSKWHSQLDPHTGRKLIPVNKMWVYEHVNIQLTNYFVNFWVELLKQPQDLFCNMSCGCSALLSMEAVVAGIIRTCDW